MSLKEDLTEIKSELKELRELVVQLRVDVAQLKIKSGIWGALGALAVVATWLLMK